MNQLKSALRNMFHRNNFHNENQDDYSQFPINNLPDIVLEEIFLRLTSKELTQKLVLVCKKWHNIIENNSFWVQKCIRDKRLTEKQIELLNNKLLTNKVKKFYFSNILKRNLLKNSCGEQKFNHWYFFETGPTNFNSNANFNDEKLIKNIIKTYDTNHVKNGGPNDWSYEWANYSNGWSIEKEPTDTYEQLIINDKLLSTFVTSHYLGKKLQVIDLEKEGLNEDIFAKLMPDIEISEHYASRLEIGFEYFLKVLLVSKDFEIIDSFAHESVREFPINWICVKHRFNYDSSKKIVRYILFYHAGKVS